MIAFKENENQYLDDPFKINELTLKHLDNNDSLPLKEILIISSKLNSS
jgi:hypothetical protein